MFTVQRVAATPSSVKHMQYAYLEHLQLYPNASNQPRLDESVSFLDRLEQAHLQTPSIKERDFLQKRTTFRNEEELLQQMNYTNGLHYSQLHNIHTK